MKFRSLIIILSIVGILTIKTNISYGKYVIEDTLVVAQIDITVEE